MYKFLKLLLLIFIIVCITGCPPAKYLSPIDKTSNELNAKLKTSNYEIDLRDILPFHHKSQKGIYFFTSIDNKTNENLQLICSKSMLFSKSDTLTYWRNTHSLSDTLIITPGDHNIEIFYLGKQEYTARAYRRTYKNDTFYFKMNLFGRDSIIIPLHHHHNGPIWSRY